jgi:hypothetical protein
MREQRKAHSQSSIRTVPFLFVLSAFFRGEFVPFFFQAIEFVPRQLDALVERIWRVVIRTARIRREKTQKTQKGRGSS